MTTIETEIVATDEFRTPRMMTHSREMPDDIGRFAMSLIERWGLVAGKPDGEDSSGRAKLTLLPVDEVVSRAVDTAEMTYAALRERGHLIATPSWEELREMAREERERN